LASKNNNQLGVDVVGGIKSSRQGLVYWLIAMALLTALPALAYVKWIYSQVFNTASRLLVSSPFNSLFSFNSSLYNSSLGPFPNGRAFV